LNASAKNNSIIRKGFNTPESLGFENEKYFVVSGLLSLPSSQYVLPLYQGAWNANCTQGQSMGLESTISKPLDLNETIPSTKLSKVHTESNY